MRAGAVSRRPGARAGASPATRATQAGTNRTIRTVTTRNDPEDIVRRQLANALRVGLLNYLVADSVPPNLSVTVRLGAADRAAAPTHDKWNHWVFSIRGYASFSGEESNASGSSEAGSVPTGSRRTGRLRSAPISTTKRKSSISTRTIRSRSSAASGTSVSWG